jgi:transcriptional regulator with XRE-family HTH domain
MPTIPTAYTQKPDELVCTLIRAGWSQGEIADAIDATQPTVSRILSGRHKDPRYSVVEKLRQLVLNLDEFQVAA